MTMTTDTNAQLEARGGHPLSALGAQVRTELVTMLRSPASIIPTLLFPLMFWTFFGLPNANQRFDNGFNVGAYILASFAMYSGIQTVLFNLGIFIASERSTGWYRFLRTTPAPVWVVFTAKIVAVLALAFAALAVLLVYGAFTGGISLPLETWLSLIGHVMIGVLPFAALAVFIGYIAKGTNSASPIINLIFFPMAFASGLFVPLSSLPKVVQDIAPFLPAYHGGALARMSIGVPSDVSQLTHVVWLLGFTVLFLILAVWAYKRDESSNYR
jgi:ABC-2 type transport system permease protein